jgi:hypothetical protein
MVELNNEDALRFAIAAPQQKVGYQNITGIFGDMTTTAGYDPKPTRCAPKRVRFNYTRLSGVAGGQVIDTVRYRRLDRLQSGRPLF